MAFVSLMACSVGRPGNGPDEDFHDESGFDCESCSGSYRCGASLLSDDNPLYRATSDLYACSLSSSQRAFTLHCASGKLVTVTTEGKLLLAGSWKADRGILSIDDPRQPPMTCIPEGDAGTFSF